MSECSVEGGKWIFLMGHCLSLAMVLLVLNPWRGGVSDDS